MIRTSSPPLEEADHHDILVNEHDFDNSWLDEISWNHTKNLFDYRLERNKFNKNVCKNLEQTTHTILENTYNPVDENINEYLGGVWW